MRGLTDYITKCDWADVFLCWFVLVDDSYQRLFGTGRQRRRGPAPVCSDAEVITLGLVCATYFHGHEALMLAFVRQHYLALFPHLLSPSRFNRRRRALTAMIEAIRQDLSRTLLDAADDLRLIDSAPISVCAYERAHQCETVSGSEYYSVLPNVRGKLFGFHLDLLMSVDQVVDCWMLAPAAPHDSHMAEALLEDRLGLWIVGDNGFRSPDVMRRLWRQRGIRLIAPPRRNQVHGQWSQAWRKQVTRLRRRIESAMSVLATVFHIEHPGSRSLSGLVARTATRILAYTISFRTSILLQPISN